MFLGKVHFLLGGWAGIFENVFAKTVVALPLTGLDLCVTLHKDAHKNVWPSPCIFKQPKSCLKWGLWTAWYVVLVYLEDEQGHTRNIEASGALLQPTRLPHPDYSKLPNFHYLSWSELPLTTVSQTTSDHELRSSDCLRKIS